MYLLQKVFSCLYLLYSLRFEGIVSGDFGGLEMILMDRLCDPGVPLDVYSFLNLHLHKVFVIC